MGSALGNLLRSLRTSRRETLASLAHAAQISPRTLIRWENGAVTPRVPELRAVLTALEASPPQTQQALALLDQPRGQDALYAAALPETLLSRGELLRALRHRRELALETVAATLGVQASTLSRWENNKTGPSSGQLGRLLDYLEASPPERQALASSATLLAGSLDSPLASVEEADAALAQFRQDMERGQTALLDLQFLTLRSRFGVLAQREPHARDYLIALYGEYAAVLGWQGRPAEATRAAQRALEWVDPRQVRSEAWVSPVSTIAASLPSPNQKVTFLQFWAERGGTFTQASLCREIADYLHRAGHTDAALRYIDRSHELSVQLSEQEPRYAHLLPLARIIRATILARGGQPQRALTELEREQFATRPLQVQATLLHAETLLRLGETQAAHASLALAQNLLQGETLPWLAALAETLAQGL